MEKTTPDQLFGELRSLLSQDLKRSSRHRDELLALLSRVQRLYPEVYERRWRPYLNTVSRSWPVPFKQVRTLRWLEQWTGLSDVLTFGWSLDVTSLDDVALLTDVCAMPWAIQLSALRLSSAVRQRQLSQSVTEALRQSPSLSSLSQLTLAFAVLEVPALRVIWDAPELVGLTHLALHLRGASGVCCEALAKPPASKQLKHLEITHLEGERFTLFSESSWLSQLESVDLSHSRFLTKDMFAIGEMVRQSGVKSLTLTDSGIRNLDRVFDGDFGQLEVLVLKDNFLNSKSLSQPLGQVHTLDLCRCDLWYDWVSLIEQMTDQSSIQVLRLGETGLSPELIEALVRQGQRLPALHTLDLSHNDVFRRGVQALGESVLMNTLTHLDLTGSLQSADELEPLLWSDRPAFTLSVVVDRSIWDAELAALFESHHVRLIC